MNRLMVIAVALVAMLVCSLAQANVLGVLRARNVTSTENSLDTATDVSASTAIVWACDDNTDWSYTATSSLLCANTGNIIVGGAASGYKTASLDLWHDNSSATAVIVQCATTQSLTAAGPWALVSVVDSSDVVTDYNPSRAVSGDKSWSLHFEINAVYLRCMVWGTAADANDRIVVKMRLLAD